MSFTKFSEKIVLNRLKDIENGNLRLVNYDGKVFHFGNLESKLSADIKIYRAQNCRVGYRPGFTIRVY